MINLPYNQLTYGISRNKAMARLLREIGNLRGLLPQALFII